MADVMTQPVITLQRTDDQDIFAALGLLRQYHIRHLPLVDEHHQLLGLVTPTGIRRALQPNRVVVK